jgi:hypothetical protein
MTKPPARVPPSAVPEEAIERLHRRERPTPIAGDVKVTRESAARLGSPSIWRYRLDVHADPAPPRYFARYEAAVTHGEELASQRKVSLMYVEDGTLAILMNYRSISTGGAT